MILLLVTLLVPGLVTALQNEASRTEIASGNGERDAEPDPTEPHFRTDLSDDDRRLYETMRVLAEAMRTEASERVRAAALAYLLTAMDRPRIPDPEVTQEFVDLSSTTGDGAALQWMASVCGIFSPRPEWCRTSLLDESIIRFDDANLLSRAWIAEWESLLASLENEPRIAWYDAELTRVWFDALQSAGDISGLKEPGDRLSFAFGISKTYSHPRFNRIFELCEGRVIRGSSVDEGVLRRCERLADRMIHDARSIEEWRFGHRLFDMTANVRMFGDVRKRPDAFGRLSPVELEVSRYRCRERRLIHRMPEWSLSTVEEWLELTIEVGALEAVTRAAERMGIDCESPLSEANRGQVTRRTSGSGTPP